MVKAERCIRELQSADAMLRALHPFFAPLVGHCPKQSEWDAAHVAANGRGVQRRVVKRPDRRCAERVESFPQILD